MTRSEAIIGILEEAGLSGSQEVQGTTAYDHIDNAIAGALDDIDNAILAADEDDDSST